MGTKDIDVTVTSSAPPSAVYALLVDGPSWPTWSDFDAYELIEPAPDGGSGVGAVHVHKKGARRRTTERIVELVPDRRYSYALVSGLPLEGYRADVDLRPTPDGGTSIRWHSTFRPKTPGTGWLYRAVLRRFIQQTAAALAAHAAAQRTGAQPGAEVS